MNVECSACHLDADFLSQGSGTPILYLTRCGHICCDMCRTNWFASGRETCPKCRQPQTRSDLIRIYYDIAQHAQPSSSPAATSQEPEAELQASSEYFLKIVADKATDIFGATRDFLQRTITHVLPARFSRAVNLISAALCRIENDFAQLRAAYQQLQTEHNTLKTKYRRLKRKHVELEESGEKLARKRGQDLKRMSERYAIQESSLRRDLQAMSTRAEIAESELSTKDEEIRELKDSRLLFKKKYHALKQRQSQNSKTPDDAGEDSLVILH